MFDTQSKTMQQGATDPLIDVRDLSVHIAVKSPSRKGAVVYALDEVNLSIARGETLGVVGESGGGKSTLGRAIARLRAPTHGSVHYRGRDLSTFSAQDLRLFRRQIQMVFQDPDGSLNPRMTVGDLVGEPLLIHKLCKSSERRDKVRGLLTLVGLDPDSIDRWPHEFSGGQRQRIGIARALAVQPEFLVLDEPVSALDVSIQAQILNLLMDLRKELDLTYLFVSHDLSAVRHISNRVAVMYLGKIVEIGTTAEVFGETAHPYTRALISAMPVANPVVERSRKRIILPGNPPSPLEPPSGCRFHPRCWLHEALGRPAKCRETPVPLMDVSANHASACHFWRDAIEKNPKSGETASVQ